MRNVRNRSRALVPKFLAPEGARTVGAAWETNGIPLKNYPKESTVTTPDMAALAASLTEVAVRNTASVVFSRVAAIRSKKNDREAVSELADLVNELIADKAELVGIAKAFEQELVSQRISHEDISYITGNVIPVVEKLADFSEADHDTQEVVDAVKSLVSVETVTIMQLVGFNFRRAIGEPLTALVERLILKQMPSTDANEELQVLHARREVAYLEALSIPEARAILDASSG